MNHMGVGNIFPFYLADEMTSYLIGLKYYYYLMGIKGIIMHGEPHLKCRMALEMFQIHGF